MALKVAVTVTGRPALAQRR